MTPPDIALIERATVAAVAPEALEELDGWLLPFDSGTINRARAAVPLTHQACDESLLARIEARYLARGLPPAFRLATEPCFEGLRRDLLGRGYRTERPALVQVGTTQAMLEVTDQPPADTDPAPDAAWAALFLGEGFDPVDGASRVKALSRAHGTRFASVREGDGTVAAGAGAFSHGWASVHGMRTNAAFRRRGFAGRVLAGLARAAQQQGLARTFLQVEEGNAAAEALYRRAGFSTVWSYEYWRRP